jgi:hypothetical protein
MTGKREPEENQKKMCTHTYTGCSEITLTRLNGVTYITKLVKNVHINMCPETLSL